jgi:hypothetical protein
MRRAKQDAAARQRATRIHHTPSEKKHLKRVRNKTGPAGVRRAERRKHLQPTSILADVTKMIEVTRAEPGFAPQPIAILVDSEAGTVTPKEDL